MSPTDTLSSIILTILALVVVIPSLFCGGGLSLAMLTSGEGGTMLLGLLFGLISLLGVALPILGLVLILRRANG